MRKAIYLAGLLCLAFNIAYASPGTGARSNRLAAHSLFWDDARKIEGRVVDSESRKAVEFVTVALRDTSSRVLAAATTDSLGRFSLPLSASNRESLSVEFSLVGYKAKTLTLQTLFASASQTASGTQASPDATKHPADGSQTASEASLTVSLEPDTQLLQGATVTDKRPLLEHKFDKIVMNVSELAAAQTGNATDVLRSAPGVTFDKDGNILLNGQSVSVWLDGRPSNMSGKELQSYLKGSTGTAIEKIEIISSPSAKYDAEGSGGIINIKTRRGFLMGFNGSITANGQYRWEPSSNAGGDGSVRLGYKGERSNTTLSYNGYYGEFLSRTDEIKRYASEYASRLNTVTDSRSYWKMHQVMLSSDFNATDSDILGVIFKMNFGSDGSKWPDSSLAKDYKTLDAETPYSEKTSSLYSGSGDRQYNLNLNYTHTFDEALSQELTLNADYNFTRSNASSFQRNLYSSLSDEAKTFRETQIAAGEADPFAGDGLNDSTFRRANIWSLKADFSQNLWDNTGRVEAGAKAAVSITDNRYSTYAWDPSTPTETVGKKSGSNDFVYSEQIYALYANLSKQFNEKWNAQAGLRGEFTVPRGVWKSEDKRSGKNYFDLFPNVFVTWMPSQKAILSLNYSYRISRPKYWQLNPFREYLNSTTWSTGDPDLQPSYSNSVSLTGVFFSHLSLTAGYTHENNYNEQQLPLLDQSTGVLEYRYSNSGVQQMAFASLALSEQNITKWWTLTLNASYRYTFFRAYDREDLQSYAGYTRNSHAFVGYGSTTFYIPCDFKFTVDGWGMTPQTAGYFTLRGMMSINASLQKSFLDSRLNLTLRVDDIFNTMSTTLSLYDGQTEVMSMATNNSFRGISLGVTYTFGKTAASSRNVGGMEEADRL